MVNKDFHYRYVVNAHDHRRIAAPNVFAKKIASVPYPVHVWLIQSTTEKLQASLDSQQVPAVQR